MGELGVHMRAPSSARSTMCGLDARTLMVESDARMATCPRCLHAAGVRRDPNEVVHLLPKWSPGSAGRAVTVACGWTLAPGVGRMALRAPDVTCRACLADLGDGDV